jgi:WhiB family redox-sensing transcriptional regulator
MTGAQSLGMEVPEIPAPDWSRALCGGADGDLFFRESPVAEARAVAICALCPLRAACAGWALGTRQRHGVWGGTTPAQRHEAWGAAGWRRGGALVAL